MMILIKHTLRVFIALSVVISCVFSGFVTANADEVKTQNTTNSIIQNADNKESYSAYLQKYSKSDYADTQVVHKLSGAVLDAQPIEFNIKVEKDGLYGIGMSYKALETQMSSVRIGLKIDGKYPYSKTSDLDFPRMWRDSEGINTDKNGNQYVPKQVIYEDYYYNEAIDNSLEATEKFMVYLSKGEHTVTLISVEGKIKIEYFKFSSTASPESYVAPQNDSQYYKGEPLIFEGESAKVKSSYFLVGKSNTSSLKITPNSAENTLINYVGGNWKTVGETIVWETGELEAGYYQLGFSFRQNGVIGSKSYRTLKIDGEIPFAEAENLGFDYGDDWQQNVYADDDGKPYLIYLSKGKHEISLSVAAADISDVRKMLTEAVAEMGDLYVDMTKITGETVDIYRDYDLFRQIGDMEERLVAIRKNLETSANRLREISGGVTGSNYSVIMNMVRVIDQMLNNKFEAHRNKSNYYTNYCSVSSVLLDLRSMPLELDKFTLSAPNSSAAFEKVGFFEQILFSVKRFMISFTREYNGASDTEGSEKDITIWVNWGRDQAQVLSALVDRGFTPKTGINVNLKLVNATVIQAILSGKGPDVLLQSERSTPVNYAMRGVLYDLSQFDDCDEVLKRFQKGADVPYRYKGGLYALPDTHSFFVMFYRKDILAEYGIEVPKTWEEFDLAAKLLMRNNMNVCLPASTSTDSMYPTMLLQNGVSLYADEGHKTNLLSSDAAEVFEKWTDYYTKLKFPITMDFYNRFRTGTTPLGISVYTLYTTLKVAAPEIEGLWGFTTIPGTVREDGSISYASAGTGTGCSILNLSKNPKNAWKFLKWWTDAETQVTYSNDLEAVLGPTGRVALSNINAIKDLAWDDGAAEQLLDAWQSVRDIPEYPGSYYVTRAIYQSFWNVANSNKNTKDMLMKYGKQADSEIARKWKQYTNR